MKIVINRRFGGFGLSKIAISKLRQYGTDIEREISRNDPNLVRVVEELGEAAGDDIARLRVVEIPDGVEWTIEEYDGREHVAEKHRTWHGD